MPAPTKIKKNGVILQASDLCPRGNCGAVQGHLVSDHSDETRVNQCSRCACVIQTVGNHVGTQNRG